MEGGRLMANKVRREAQAREHTPTLTERLIAGTFGQAISFFFWFLFAVLISIIIEWVGMLLWWDSGHSRRVLEQEVVYLSQLNGSTLLNLKPIDVAHVTSQWVTRAYDTLGAHHWLPWLAETLQPIFIAVSSAMDVTYTLIIRLATVVLAIPAFIFWGALALVDGLVERDVRRACGGIEQAFFYHHVKPFIKPSLAVGCGLYLTLPFSFNPGLYFLVPQAAFFSAVFYTATTFKKYT